MKNFNFDLKRGTTALTVKYFNKHKDEIFPVLNKVSLAYQKYSNRDRLDSINKGLIYLEDQIKNFEQKSKDSFKESQNLLLNII